MGEDEVGGLWGTTHHSFPLCSSAGAYFLSFVVSNPHGLPGSQFCLFVVFLVFSSDSSSKPLLCYELLLSRGRGEQLLHVFFIQMPLT